MIFKKIKDIKYSSWSYSICLSETWNEFWSECWKSWSFESETSAVEYVRINPTCFESPDPLSSCWDFPCNWSDCFDLFHRSLCWTIS